MYGSRTARAVLTACLGIALLLTGATASFAAERTSLADSAGSKPARAYKPLGAVKPLALPPGWAETDLPPGNTLRWWAPADGGRTVWVPMYKGMSAHLECRGGAPLNWVMALWNGYLNPNDPLVYDAGAHTPLVVNYTAGQVTGDYGDGVVRTYDWGWYPVDVYRPDVKGSFTLTWDVTDPPVTTPVYRVAGSDRVGTSVETAKWGFGATATDTVVIATGRDFPDALAASALCGSYGAPLLLTNANTIPPVLADALDTFGVKQVFIVGGTTAVSAEVEQQLDAMPGVETSRVAGVNRYDTAVKIAQKVREHEIAMGRTPQTEAFIASGKSFPDALSVSPYAYSQRIPILLSSDAYLPPVTRDALAPLGIDTVHVVGGPSSVGNYAYGLIPAGVTKDRAIAGTDRVATSKIAAEYAVAHNWATWSQVGLVTGGNFPDALGGGVAVGNKGGVLLLTKYLYLSSGAYHAMQPNTASINDVTLFGGRGTLNGCVMGDVDALFKE